MKPIKFQKTKTIFNTTLTTPTFIIGVVFLCLICPVVEKQVMSTPRRHHTTCSTSCVRLLTAFEATLASCRPQGDITSTCFPNDSATSHLIRSDSSRHVDCRETSHNLLPQRFWGVSLHSK